MRIPCFTRVLREGKPQLFSSPNEYFSLASSLKTGSPKKKEKFDSAVEEKKVKFGEDTKMIEEESKESSGSNYNESSSPNESSEVEHSRESSSFMQRSVESKQPPESIDEESDFRYHESD